MLRLKRLTSEPESFDPIDFKSGLNLILGEKWDEAQPSGRKVNGVGKTLCVEFIQFGLLKEYGKTRLAKIPQDFLPEDCSVILDMDINGHQVRVNRSLRDHERPIIILDGSPGRMMNSLQDGLDFLSTLLFSGNSSPVKPSFRELLSLLARDEDSEFKQVGGSSPHLVPADERPFDGTAPHPSTTSPIPERELRPTVTARSVDASKFAA